MYKKKNWINYFENIKNKYNLKVTDRLPLVIFLDGKNITGNKSYNLIDENKNSFNDALEQSVEFFSKKFDCIAISGVDEVSFVFENQNKLKNFIGQKKYKTHDIVSVFSQYFYNYFNSNYKQNNVYFHCKCSNIPTGKIKSYIKHRSFQIYELYITYFLKRKSVKDAGKIKLIDKIEMCERYEEYLERKEFAKGKLYKNGIHIDIDDFLLDKITEIKKVERNEFNQFLDLSEF